MIAMRNFEVQSCCRCNVTCDFLIGFLSAAAETAEGGVWSDLEAKTFFRFATTSKILANGVAHRSWNFLQRAWRRE
jgi:hypothetical protein